MGASMEKQNRREVKILITGREAAGKTTILYRIKHGDKFATVPTIGYNREVLQHKDISIEAWDLKGGDHTLRHNLHRHIYPADALVFVLDTSDLEKIREAACELKRDLLEEGLRAVPLLVLANKQDVTGALSVERVAEELKLYTVGDRQWHVQPCCALSGDGLAECMDWLCQALSADDITAESTAAPQSRGQDNDVKPDEPEAELPQSNGFCLQPGALSSGFSKFGSFVWR